jgi:DNA invertase Pin-like site-specific DNA recombinase
MKVACYVQRDGRRGERERAEVRAWLSSAGVRAEDVEWFSDERGAAEEDRPGFDRLQAAIAGGEVRTVVLWKLDRLGPRLQDGVSTLADWCGRGLKIVVVSLRLEFDGDVGRPLASLLLGLSEVEQGYRRSRQAAGIADAKKRGAYKGRKRGTTKASPEQVRGLRDKGLTVAEIADATGISVRTVTRYLARVGDA